MAHAFVVPNAQTPLFNLPRIPARNDNDTRSFRLDEAVRLATAGKCYKPAPHWSLCAECAEPCSSNERLEINRAEGTVRHERCL